MGATLRLNLHAESALNIRNGQEHHNLGCCNHVQPNGWRCTRQIPRGQGRCSAHNPTAKAMRVELRRSLAVDKYAEERARNLARAATWDY